MFSRYNMDIADSLPMAVDGEVAHDPVQDLGAWIKHEGFLRFRPCTLCSSAEPHCHCAYMENTQHQCDHVDLVAPCRKTPHANFLRMTLGKDWKGLIIVPQGASDRFQRIGSFKLPGHSDILDP
jgi:hypothetical protein